MRARPQRVYYKSLSGEDVVPNENESFTGFKVRYTPQNNIWAITGVSDNKDTYNIRFWTGNSSSTDYNKINTISFNGMHKWYNANGILLSARYESNGMINGEVLKTYEFYDPEGKGHLVVPKYTSYYYSNNIDVTKEIYDLTEGRTGINEFTEEDRFNIYVKYGSFFKFYPEYNTEFNIDEIVKKCLKQ